MSLRFICVAASRDVCATRVLPSIVCVSVVNFVFHAFGFVGTVCIAAWWYVVPVRLFRYPPRYRGFVDSDASIATVTTSGSSPGCVEGDGDSDAIGERSAGGRVLPLVRARGRDVADDELELDVLARVDADVR
jgi:hypothetical protein